MKKRSNKNKPNLKRLRKRLRPLRRLSLCSPCLKKCNLMTCLVWEHPQHPKHKARKARVVSAEVWPGLTSVECLSNQFKHPFKAVWTILALELKITTLLMTMQVQAGTTSTFSVAQTLNPKDHLSNSPNKSSLKSSQLRNPLKKA
jgi:hypothetical protein